MSKTFKQSRPIQAALLADGSPVEESTLRRFCKAFKKFTHRRERRSLRLATIKEMEEAL